MSVSWHKITFWDFDWDFIEFKDQVKKNWLFGNIESSYPWIRASLVAQLVKNLPAVPETCIPSLDFPWRREGILTPVLWNGGFHGLYSPWDHKESTLPPPHLFLLCIRILQFSAHRSDIDIFTHKYFILHGSANINSF